MTNRLDFADLLYQHEHDLASLIKGIESVLGAENRVLRALPVAIEKHADKNWQAFFKKFGRDVSQIRSGSGVDLLCLKYGFREEGVQTMDSGLFFIAAHPDYDNIWIFLTIERPEFWRRGLLPLVQGLYPKIAMTFISHRRLRRLLDKLVVDWALSEIRIKRASLRLRVGQEKQGQRATPMVSWPDMALEDVFEWVYQQNGWFQSLQFEALRDHRRLAEIWINRQGAIRTNAGVAKVFDALIEPVCKMTNNNMILFGNRARKDNQGLDVRPLVVDFGLDQFSSVDENKKFIEALKLLPKASVSVLHGNPYVHTSVLDYFDGSSFDVWVLNTKQLFIVPQMKSTVTSIRRLISHIFDAYAEGAIKDYQESQLES